MVFLATTAFSWVKKSASKELTKKEVEEVARHEVQRLRFKPVERRMTEVCVLS